MSNGNSLKKIVCVTMLFPSKREAFASNEIRMLYKLEESVSIHSLRPKASYCDQLIQERMLSKIDISFYNFNSLYAIINSTPLFLEGLFLSVKWLVKSPSHLIKTIILLPRIIEIFQIIKKEKPEIVHLYWSHFPALLGYLVKRRLPFVKVSMSLAAYDLTMNYEFSKKLIPLCDIIITHAKINTKAITNLAKTEREIKVIYRGVDPIYFNLTKPIKIPHRIVTAGALVKVKGIAYVIDVFKSIKENWPDASLVILGDGPERKHLERRLVLEKLNNVEFKGHVSHKNVIEEMRKSEVFLFLSYQDEERLPNVVKEAMSSYCYCIVSNTMGITELVIPNYTGAIVPLHDVKQAFQELNSIFNNREEMETRVQRAFKHVKTNFNLEDEMKTYLQLWRELI